MRALSPAPERSAATALWPALIVLIALAIACGRYGSPRRPSPRAQVAAPEAVETLPAETDREEQKKPGAKPSADGSPRSY